MSDTTGAVQHGGWLRQLPAAVTSLFCATVTMAALSACSGKVPVSKSSEQPKANVARTATETPSQTNLAKLEPAHTQSKEEQSCQKFVQSFYDWYVFNMLDGECRKVKRLKEQDFSNSCKGASQFHSIAVMSLKQVLSPKLKTLQDEETTIMTKEGDPGLDFDEYLNSQDPSPKYEVESVQSKEGHCNAVVNGIEEGQIRERVMPELINAKGEWRFVNFHYSFNMGDGKPSHDDDLIQMLEGYIDDMKNLKK